MAIYYPDVAFTLIDGTGKKVQAVRDMAERLGLTNVRAFHVRAEDVSRHFSFVCHIVSRRKTGQKHKTTQKGGVSDSRGFSV